METINVKTQICIQLLEEKGYNPQKVGDDMIEFKTDDGYYVIFNDLKDELYFRLSYPTFFEIKTDKDRALVQKVCDFVNRGTKVAKIYTVENNVWGNIEIFLPTPDSIKLIFFRCLSALQYAVNAFKAEITKREPSIVENQQCRLN